MPIRVPRRMRKLSANIPVFFAVACFCLAFVTRNTLIGDLGFGTIYDPSDQPFLKGSYSPPLKLDQTKFRSAVHLVHTRFMQGQPNLLALGNSRIELFKNFCLPTMAKQTTSDFLWIILIDPELDPILLGRLQQLLQPYPHFYLYKQVTQEIDLQDLNLSLVESGDKDLLLQAAYEARFKILMQTRLDADDGLASIYIEQTQRTAVETLQPSNSLSPKGWMIQCVKKHFEWHYDLQKNTTSDLTGWLRLSVTPSFCVTPGLTLAVAPNGQSWKKDEPLPIYPHDRITRRFQRCSPQVRTDCFHILNEIREPAAVRSRTPASSFMRGVGTTDARNTPDNDWNKVVRDFGIERKTFIQTRIYLMDNVEAISKENLESHCTGMNPCWGDRKEKLVALAGNITNVNENAVAIVPNRFKKVVHIVHTRFMQGQPNLLELGGSRLELFKTFCLPTMVNQTTKDFLWVILIDPFIHPHLLEEISLLVKPYPNFFVVREMAEEIDLDKFLPSLIHAGDVNILKQAAIESKSKILLHTRLDADDGLAINLIKHLQDNAVKTLQGNDTEPSGWMLQCVRLHFEWHYDMKNKTRDLNGWLKVEDTNWFCVTPGLTLAVAPGGIDWTDRSPMYPHDKIMTSYPKCDLSKGIRSRCFHTMSELTEPAAVRSRTPASSFMRGIGTTKKEKDTPEEHWKLLEKSFTIEQETLAETRNYLLGNVQSIAKENLLSQCTGMNPCRDGDKKRLSALAGI